MMLTRHLRKGELHSIVQAYKLNRNSIHYIPQFLCRAATSQ